MDTVLQDLRYGARVLRQAPTFTIVAVTTLALGIGAAVAIFTIVNAVLLRPLPILEPDRLGVITAQYQTQGARIGASWTKFESLRAQRTAFADVAAYVTRDLTIDGIDGPARVRGARVTANLTSVLGISPRAGRSLTAADEIDGAPSVAVITDALWQGAFGSDAAIPGRAVRIDGRAVEIVGVLPPSFKLQFSDAEPQVYLAGVTTSEVMTPEQIHSGAGFLTYLGRLAPHASFADAQKDPAAVDARYRREFGSYADASNYALRLTPFTDDLVGAVRPALLILMGAVLLLFAIACANVAHLQLARAAVRRREVAVRLALGASSARLLRQFLAEATLIAAGGGLIGVVLAKVAVTLLVTHGPAGIPRLADAAPDRLVLLFAAGLAGLTAIVFGLAPALRVRGLALGEALKAGRSAGLISRASGRVQHWIATSETAITVVLLVAAILLFQSLTRLQAVDPGFDADHVTTARITLPPTRYDTPERRETFFTALIEDLQAQPGIATVGATSYLPMAGDSFGFFFFVDGRPHLGVGRDPTISVRHVSADFFAALRVPVRRGRVFTSSDTARAPLVALINERAARTFFPDADPIGQHVANSRDGIMREIVGVVGDVRFFGPAQDVPAELFLPYQQMPWPAMTVVASSTLPADSIASTIRRSVRRLDPEQAVSDLRPMPVVVASTTRQERLTSALLGAFAFMATALAATGLYGVIAMFVSQRRHEFGIRLAVGAQRTDVFWLILRHGITVMVIGTAAGLAGAAAASRLMTSLLFGVGAAEPMSYVIGCAVLFASGLLACYFPARRAMAISPALTLRAD